MPRPATLRQSDITRTARAIQAAGLAVVRVEVQGDKVVFIMSGAPEPPASALDQWRLARGPG